MVKKATAIAAIRPRRDARSGPRIAQTTTAVGTK
jgi:hypothetical protein